MPEAALDKVEFSADAQAKIRQIYQLVIECTAEIAGCGPDELKYRWPETKSLHHRFQAAARIVTANLFYPDWAQNKQASEVAPYLADAIGAPRYYTAQLLQEHAQHLEQMRWRLNIGRGPATDEHTLGRLKRDAIIGDITTLMASRLLHLTR